MKIENSQFLSNLQVNGQLPVNKTIPRQQIGTGLSFQEVLNRTTEQNQVTELKFSKHASERLISRNIDLSESQKERLNHAVKAAEAKGIKESLVMMDNLAFIINVKNNTVVTAVTGGEEKIFSNIDGAVVV